MRGGNKVFTHVVSPLLVVTDGVVSLQVVTKVEGLEAYGFNTQLCAREFQKKLVAYFLISSSFSPFL